MERGQLVRKDSLLGFITDFHGNMLAEVRAPQDGVLRYFVATPPISEGETIASIGRMFEPPEGPSGDS